MPLLEWRKPFLIKIINFLTNYFTDSSHWKIFSKSTFFKIIMNRIQYSIYLFYTSKITLLTIFRSLIASEYFFFSSSSIFSDLSNFWPSSSTHCSNSDFSPSKVTFEDFTESNWALRCSCSLVIFSRSFFYENLNQILY